MVWKNGLENKKNMKTKEKTFGDLKVGDEFYVVNIEHGYIAKRKVLKVLDTIYNECGMVALSIVDKDSIDYENDSHITLFPKNFTLHGMLYEASYATTINSAREFVKHWERTSKKEIKEKANKMMELLNK